MKTNSEFLPLRAARWALLLVAMPLLLGASVAPPPEPEAGVRIEIKHHAFSLPTVTVPAGTTVSWVNHDDDVHTVVSTTALFRSPGLDTDDAYSYRFRQPGTYRYFCTLHPLMVGTVIVR